MTETRRPARSFSKARMTGAHMSNKEPELLKGEVFLVAGETIHPVTLYDIKGYVQADEGTIWGTNFRTIFRFYETGEFSIPHSNVLRVVKEGFIREKEQYSFHCRDISVEVFAVPLITKPKKELMKLIGKYCKGPKTTKKLFCFSHPASAYKTDGWKIFSISEEFQRQGADMNNWRISVANLKYDLCSSYPTQIVVPSGVVEECMFKIAQIRVKGRVQGLTWGSAKGAFLMRSSQFNMTTDDGTGFVSSQYSKPNDLYMKEVLKFTNSNCLNIFDTDFLSEKPQPNLYSIPITENYLGLPTEASIHDALKTLVNLCTGNQQIAEGKEWLTKSTWLQYVSQLLCAAEKIGCVLDDGNPVLLQSDSGVNLLSALSALSQILIDPYYRTIKGFCILVEKDFIYFGHKFGTFTGKKVPDEYSCIFLMFLDGLWQIIQQFPLSFQYSEDFLLYLINAIYSSQFGTFVSSCEKERSEYMKKTPSVWSYILDNEKEFYNPLYTENNSFLQLDGSEKRMRLWSAFYLRHKCRFSLLKVDKAIQTAFSKRVAGLEFSNLKIPSMPCDGTNLEELEHVKSINLSDNILNKIPLSLIAATNLKTLSLSGNVIPFIADDFLDLFSSKISSLETLDLNGNQIIGLSNYVCRFKKLLRLKLHGNCLTQLPDISQFSELVELDIGGNSITTMDEEIFNMRTIEILNISKNSMVTLPNTLTQLTRLRELDISESPITQFPPNFNKLHNLASLNISKVNMKGIPEEVIALTQLTSLSVGGLGIQEIPSVIQNFKQIQVLDLSDNEITELPKELLELTELRHLRLCKNKLTSVPLDISKLDKLIELDLSNNTLNEYLTPGVGKLEQLRILDVSNNQLKHLPAAIGHLVKLKESGQFNFGGNEKLETPPKSIYNPGKATGQPKLTDQAIKNNVFTFLKELLDGAVKIYRMKIMLVGQENVGKTSLFRGLKEYVDNCRRVTGSSGIDKTLNNATGLSSMSTDGIDIGNLDFKILFKNDQQKKKTTVKLSVWDFAGQEIYYTTHQFFLSDRALYIVVWNIAKKEEDSRVEYWLKSINARSPEAPILIVATHMDDPICTKEYIDETVKALETKYIPQYPNIQGIHMISCLSQEGIPQLDLWIQAIVVSQPYMGEDTPKTYLELEKLVIAEKTTRVPPVVTWAEFSRMGYICNIKSQERLALAAGFLHNMGTIIYFQKHEGLDDIVILDPQWLTDVMSTIITTKHAFVKKGVLKHSDLRQLWREPEFPPYLHRSLLNLLEKFEISFYLRSTQEETEDKSMAIYTGRSLVPSLLPDDRPSIEKYWSHFPDPGERQFGRRYKFGFIPHGFISRLFVRVLHFAEPTVFWRNGMLVEHNDDAKSHTISETLIQGYFAILIEASPAQRIIDITVRGRADKLAQLIIETIDSLIVGWYSIKVDIQVPCIHCIREASYSPYMFNIEACEQAAIDGKAFIKCADIRDIRLDELVPDIAMIHVQDCKLQQSDLEIQREIGVGGFAIVYKGTFQGKVVAIKKIKFGDSSQPSLDDTTEIEAFAEFRREVWLMSGLFHLNIVQMEGFTLDPFCIITEFIHHGNLYDIIHDMDRELPWGYRWRCAMDMAKGMKYLHTTSWPPIIHRDLKTPNVLVDSLDERAEVIAKVADFGLSQVLASTTQGRSVANPVWLAPEIMKSEAYTEKADVYSYGVMLYELASREDFFGDSTFMSALENRVIEGERPVIPNSTPPEFAKVITACWDGDPEKRPSFVEICESLKAGMEIHCPTLVEIACADKEIVPQRKLNAKESDGSRRKIRSLEEIEAESKAMEKAKREKYEKEMNDVSKVLSHRHDASIQCLLYLPPCVGRTTSVVWSGASDGVISVWDLEGNLIETVNAHSKQVFSMIIVGETVWTVSADEVIRIFYAKNAKLKKEIKNAPLLCLENVGKHVWGGSMDSYVYSYDSKAGKQKKKFRIIEGGPVFCLHYVQSTGVIWAGTDLPGKSMVMVNLKGKPIGNDLVGHKKKVNAIIECNGYIWSCSSDKTIMIWNHEGTCIRLLQGHSGPIFSIVDTGTHVWSASWDKKIIIWDAEYHSFFKEFLPHDDAVSSVIYIRENGNIWSGSWDKSIRLWSQTPL